MRSFTFLLQLLFSISLKKIQIKYNVVFDEEIELLSDLCFTNLKWSCRFIIQTYFYYEMGFIWFLSLLRVPPVCGSEALLIKRLPAWIFGLTAHYNVDKWVLCLPMKKVICQIHLGCTMSLFLDCTRSRHDTNSGCEEGEWAFLFSFVFLNYFCSLTIVKIWSIYNRRLKMTSCSLPLLINLSNLHILELFRCFHGL